MCNGSRENVCWSPIYSISLACYDTEWTKERYFLLVHLIPGFSIVCRKMIKLFKVKEKQREIAESANGKIPVKKQSAGELRLHKG